MTRKELYAEVIKYNLQSSIKDALNKSYTNCTNEELFNFITKSTNYNYKSLSSQVQRLVHILYNKKLLTKKELESILK